MTVMKPLLNRPDFTSVSNDFLFEASQSSMSFKGITRVIPVKGNKLGSSRW